MSARFEYTSKNCILDRDGCMTPSGEDPNITFTCKLKGIRCEGIKADGNRCTRKTVRALPYCWQHYQKINRVIIKRSGVPGAGFGLFVCDRTKKKGEVVFKKNDLIAQYNGDALNNAELNSRYGSGGQTATYTWYNDKLKVNLDSACKRYLGAFANDPKGTGKRANTTLKHKKVNQRDRDHINHLRYKDLPSRVSGLVALRDIKNGEEVLVNYGADWWDGVLGKYEVKSSTKRGSKSNQRCRYKS